MNPPHEVHHRRATDVGPVAFELLFRSADPVSRSPACRPKMRAVGSTHGVEENPEMDVSPMCLPQNETPTKESVA